MIPDFKLEEGRFSALLLEHEITTFSSACTFVQKLPYKRISDKENLELVLSEGCGTCSSKHAFLAQVALENNHPEVELICGIFLMSEETHPVLDNFFTGKQYTAIPEAHCYLKYRQQRLDFTTGNNRMPFIERKLLREHKIEPHQANEWKTAMHRAFLKSYLDRHPETGSSFDAFWSAREECIARLSKED